MFDPKLKNAFIKAVKHYFDDNDLDEFSKVSGERKYNKKYFDTLETELLTPQESKELKKKVKKESAKKESKDANK